MYPIGLVRQLVRHFADLAGWEGDRYVVTLSRRTFDRAALRVGAKCVDEAGEDGATLTTPGRIEPERDPVTWINPSMSDIRALARTCAHEALHAARPSMRHGRAFEKAVTRLTRGLEP
jgi:hypothetical protein